MLDQQFQEFLAYMARNHKSKDSIRSYQNTYRLFIHDGYSEINTDSVENFLRDRYDNPATWNKALNHLRAFAKWAQRKGKGYYGTTVHTLMVEQQKISLSLPIIVEDPEGDALVARLYDRHKKAWAFVVLKRNTGMRFSEIHSLRRQHHKTIQGLPVIVFFGKGRAERPVPLNPAAEEAFWVWVSGDRFPSQNTIRYQMQQAEQELGIKHIKPHHFRHTVATKLDAKDVPPERIADLLGNTVEVVRARYSRKNINKLSELTGML